MAGIKPRWTQEQEWRLRELIDSGYGYADCATRLGRTRAAVVIKSKKLRATVTKVQSTLSAQDAAQLLGIDRAIVARWIYAGDITARNARTTSNPLWRITWEQLTAFLERRDRWMAWKPECITDLALREWAQEMRQDTGRWLTIVQAATQLHVSRWTVSGWVREKRLPAVRYYQWWVHSDDLIDFPIPANNLYGLSRRLMDVLTKTPQPTTQLAAQIDACMSSTYHALRRLVASGHVKHHGKRIATWSKV